MARNNKRTLQEIDDEITKLKAEAAAKLAKLESEANAIRESEKADVVAKMKNAVAYYGITAADMGFSGARGKASKSKKKTKTNGKAQREPAVATRVKYKDDAGNAWSGYGRKPKWLLDALAGGKTLDDMLA
ncbi:H-NS histone family protein [Ottowia sp.]|uniref:H-NS histone family protein n=1 Tax=Ottowia sp. TaxID=1898956 RepID=UPI00260AAFEA|nr:H-NS histone family protein [Ottowia sp.]